MKTIFKYTLKHHQFQTVETHKGAKLLTTQDQREDLCVWAELDTEQPLARLQFALVPTGEIVPEGFSYLGTWQPSPYLVLHVYSRELA